MIPDAENGEQGAKGGAAAPPSLEWDWDVEHADRKREKQADAALHGATPFEVDRRVLKDVVMEHMKTPVARIEFLSAGTFHKAYLITLTTAFQLVARVARRFMPRLKTESEIATLRFLATSTNPRVPVPEVYCFDANPYNRLGGEYIIMEKAQGVPLASVYHSLGYAQLVRLLENLAKLVIPLYGHRFHQIGSLYCGPDPAAPIASPASSHAATPTLTRIQSQSLTIFPFLPLLAGTPRQSQIPPAPAHPMASIPSPLPLSSASPPDAAPQFHVGPIISWPFFGSHRGTLPSSGPSPSFVPRGPFPSTASYLAACKEREVAAVQRENAGAAGAHKLHLDPAEIRSSRHHRVAGVPGDESDESDEWGLEESEEEWEGPGDAMYRDYRRGQRGAFLVAHTLAREETVRAELGRWMRVVERLRGDWERGSGEEEEEFALDAHDLSLENVFVSAEDPTVITCIIDWESTTTRPLWAAAHLPAFLQSSPFTAKLFREALDPASSPQAKLDPTAALAREWLHHERTGMRLRMAHRVVEWDGWEEGLVESILGPEELEEEWFVDPDAEEVCDDDEHEHDDHDAHGHGHAANGEVDEHGAVNGNGDANGVIGESLSRRRAVVGEPVERDGREKEQMLDITGDICGGRGGELGRRLEAWLTVSENASPEDEYGRGLAGDDDDLENGYAAEGEGEGEAANN
ncbi:hypothetical protein C8R46DRAFT_925665 [Mycena filopes]|nr:hypothetical protein C8R46DRAFT_925665 [Mycena filopes]